MIPNLSIIIVNYNTRKLTTDCLSSIRKWCPDAQVILVDNNSRDETVSEVRRDFPEVEVVALDSNVGFARGNNAGIPLARGRYVLFLNSDTIVEDFSLDRMVVWMNQHPKCGAASPRLIDVNGSEQQALHPYPSPSRRFREIFRFSPPKPTKFGEFWLAGTCLLVRRKALEQAGGQLDPRHFMYWEDAQLCATIRKSGWELAYLSDCRIRHFGGASGGGSDSNRRLDLYSWYVWGRLAFVRRQMGAVAGALWWMMECGDVARKYLRGLLHPERSAEKGQARALLTVLTKGAPA